MPTVLMDFLQRNAANKGVMATLRYALADKTEIRAWPLLAGLKGIGPSQQARAVRTVAALFAYFYPINPLVDLYNSVSLSS